MPVSAPIPRRAPWTVALLAVLALACEPAGPAVVLGGERFAVEIADSPSKQRVGLMFRESLPADAGMLFVFPNSAPRGFWMRNCRIALDILYFDAERRLLNWHDSVPPCTELPCPTYPSEAPARYVLELNAGTARRLGVAAGDVLELRLGADSSDAQARTL